MKTYFSTGLKVIALSLITLSASVSAVGASNIRYKPLNPAFGGDPNNPDWVKFSQYANNRTPDGSGQGFPDINLPDFEELFDGLDEIPTIIIPVL